MSKELMSKGGYATEFDTSVTQDFLQNKQNPDYVKAIGETQDLLQSKQDPDVFKAKISSAFDLSDAKSSDIKLMKTLSPKKQAAYAKHLEYEPMDRPYKAFDGATAENTVESILLDPDTPLPDEPISSGYAYMSKSENASKTVSDRIRGEYNADGSIKRGSEFADPVAENTMSNDKDMGD